MLERSVGLIVQQRRMEAVRAETTVDDAARHMKKHGDSAIMVVDHAGKLVGIFTERDALYRVVAARRDPRTTRLSTVMTRNPKSLPPDRSFGFAMVLMYEGGFRHVPVVENGRPLGLVTSRDALGPEMQAFSEELVNRDHIAEILG